MKYDINLIHQYRDQQVGHAPNIIVRAIMAVVAFFTPRIPQIIIDISYWNTLVQVDFDNMALNGIKMVIIRSSCGNGYEDEKCAGYVAMARKAGLRVGLYHWVDPTDSILGQMAFFTSLITKYQPNLIALDCEQWWSDWGLWEQAIRGQVSWDRVPNFTNTALSVKYKQAWDYANLGVAHKWLYTGTWFVEEWAPSMADWIGGIPMWLAAYIKTALPTWATLKAAAANLGNLALPTNVKRAVAWQFSSSFTGVKERIDVTQFLGAFDGQAFEDYLGLPAPDPLPIVFYKLKSIYIYGYYTRATPGLPLGAIVKWESAGWSTPIIYEENGWAQTTAGWINLSYFTKGY